jgi:hypothetical protein
VALENGCLLASGLAMQNSQSDLLGRGISLKFGRCSWDTGSTITSSDGCIVESCVLFVHFQSATRIQDHRLKLIVTIGSCRKGIGGAFNKLFSSYFENTIRQVNMLCYRLTI